MMDQSEKDAGTTSNWSNATPNTRDWSPASWNCIPKLLKRAWKTRKQSKPVRFHWLLDMFVIRSL